MNYISLLNCGDEVFWVEKALSFNQRDAEHEKEKRKKSSNKQKKLLYFSTLFFLYTQALKATKSFRSALNIKRDWKFTSLASFPLIFLSVSSSSALAHSSPVLFLLRRSTVLSKLSAFLFSFSSFLFAV